MRRHGLDAGPTTPLALLLTGKYLLAGLDRFGRLESVGPHRQQVSEELGGLYLQVYRAKPTTFTPMAGASIEDRDFEERVTSLPEGKLDVLILKTPRFPFPAMEFDESPQEEFSPADIREAIERVFREPGATFLLENLHQLFGRRVRLSEVQRVEVIEEKHGRYQIVFRVQVTLSDGQHGMFGLIVSRNDGTLNALTGQEFRNLDSMVQDYPRYVVRPFALGEGALDDGRRVTMFGVEWLDAFEELHAYQTKEGVRFAVWRVRDFRMTPQGMMTELLSPEDSARVAEEIAKLLTIYFDDVRRIAIRPPEINAGDFIFRRSPTGELELRLTAATAFEAGIDEIG